jgi:NDP-sugar pyrophosphorylase family protein
MTTAWEVFVAMQEARAARQDGVTDLALRRAAMAGIDLESTPVEAIPDLGADAPAADGPVTAVVLAGGEGQRLRPLTDKVPKPLLNVGRTSILERVLESLEASGVRDVWLAVNYKAEMIEDRIGDGAGYGLRVRYLREREPLHTAGPLSLLPERPAGPILVTNADQVTALDFGRMVDWHRAEGAAITVGSFVYTTQVPYGVLDLDGTRLVGIAEKPALHSRCNAGIYVIDPAMVDLVPPDTHFGMDRLLAAAMAAGHLVSVFPILERWIDIGSPEELQQALLWFATGEEV